jgi:hypothetical protein
MKKCNIFYDTVERTSDVSGTIFKMLTTAGWERVEQILPVLHCTGEQALGLPGK